MRDYFLQTDCSGTGLNSLLKKPHSKSAQNGPGIGLQIRVVDLDGNGWKDIVVAGKRGTHILWNDGK